MTSRAALWLVLSLLSACALSHETFSPMPTPVPLPSLRDAGPPAPVLADAGPLVSCTARWDSLPWCPADTASFVGRACTTEAVVCGGSCCEPGPPIACRGGVWVAADPPDCRGVRCATPTPCGTGACAYGQVCLHPSTEILLPDRCVTAPFPITSCGDIPADWLTDDPRTCVLCTCTGTEHAEVSLECPCCDGAT